MAEESKGFWSRGVDAVRKAGRNFFDGYNIADIAAAMNGETEIKLEWPNDVMADGIRERSMPAAVLGATVADHAMGMSDRDVIREIPGIYQKFGAGVLPRDKEDRWKVIALAVNDHTAKFMNGMVNFTNVAGESIPAKPAVLPPEVAREARVRAVLETADKWRPGKRLDHELFSQLERVSWRTNKMFAYGEKHEASVVKQIREISRDDERIASRVASVSRYHVQDIPRDPGAKKAWLETAISTEFAVVRLGMTGPKHPVDLAMRPECDHLEKDREPDGMGRLKPDYSKAEARNKDMDTQIDAIWLAASSWDSPIPLCRTDSPVAPEPQVKMGESSPAMSKLLKMQIPPRDMGMGF